ncbi:MobQ family relaxase [Bacillus weihaiensis]|uniref:MobQ family relaxase n=1 Tax=Bacillus weihaiensis TaxID=1547283 RepID=UPI002357222F|nr:MobQ family relaxase [Bacillus weihaiensis]
MENTKIKTPHSDFSEWSSPIARLTKPFRLDGEAKRERNHLRSFPFSFSQKSKSQAPANRFYPIRLAKTKEVRIMAIYHLSAQVISRKKGQSLVAAAAYRSGDRLIDQRTGEIKKYVREVVPVAMILAPPHSPEWVYDRDRLWNEVEAVEKRKDAQLAREINIAFPVELLSQEELIKNYVQEQFVSKGMIADIAIHLDDPDNPHAHIMLTTRSVSENGFGPKNRDWNNKELLNEWREAWATHANQALEKEGV